jgi:hypothetical protein
MSDRLPEKDNEILELLGGGQAALWLGESLILALIEANLLNTDAILEAIDIVIAAKKAKADAGCDPDVSRAAATQLASISASIAAAKAAPAGVRRRRGRRPRSRPISVSRPDSSQ